MSFASWKFKGSWTSWRSSASPLNIISSLIKSPDRVVLLGRHIPSLPSLVSMAFSGKIELRSTEIFSGSLHKPVKAEKDEFAQETFKEAPPTFINKLCLTKAENANDDAFGLDAEVGQEVLHFPVKVEKEEFVQEVYEETQPMCMQDSCSARAEIPIDQCGTLEKDKAQHKTMTFFRFGSSPCETPDTSIHKHRSQTCHPRKKPFKCNQCSYSFHSKIKLNNHLLTHTGEKPYQCDKCSFRCSRKDYLVKHLISHSGEKPVKCEQCSFRCARKEYLTTHLKTHTGEKPYKCEVCSYRCSQKGALVIHLRTHTGERPFKCDQCSFSCVQKGTLVKHSRTHTGEKPFTCDFCSYKCSRKGNLITHLRIHTGEKPFTCKQCLFRCAHNGDLGRHLKIHTGKSLNVNIV